MSDGGNKITAELAVNEHIAVLYTKDETQYAADATVTSLRRGTGACFHEEEFKLFLKKCNCFL